VVTNNVGWRDAVIRAFIGVALLVASASLQTRPFVALGVGFMGLIFLGTALVRICPLYTLAGINTSRRNAA
jgi:DUF2892 family protein